MRLEFPLDPPGWVPEARDGLLIEPWTQDHGEIETPDGPGLGFEISRPDLRRFGKRFFTATPTRVAVRAVLDHGLSAARQLGAVRRQRLEARSNRLDESAGDPMLDYAHRESPPKARA